MGRVIQQSLFAEQDFSPDLADYVVKRTRSLTLVNSFVEQWHSSNALGLPGFRIAFVVAEIRVHKAAGAALFGRPIARKEDQETTLELTRLALADGVARNLGSWSLARMREVIRVHLPEITRLITYQNVDAHDGALYKADNWTLVYSKKKNWGYWKSHGEREGERVTHRAKWEYLL